MRSGRYRTIRQKRKRKRKRNIALLAVIIAISLRQWLFLSLSNIPNLALHFHLLTFKMELEQFTYQQILDATNQFSLGSLGSGNSGNVYKGVLHNEPVAVKVFHDVDSRERTQYDGYRSERQLMPDISHKNIVRILGYCNEDGKRILVYEALDGMTLECLLSGSNRSQCLSFKTRIEILHAICEALVYLHSLTKPPIIHRDVNASNIMVNPDSFVPKLIGFDIGRRLNPNEDSHQESDILGAPRFKDPFYVSSGCRSSLTNDVFSFGLVIIQTISGKVFYSQSELKKWVSNMDMEELPDKNLNGNFSPKVMVEALRLGQRCIGETLRPKMNRVLSHLKDMLDQLDKEEKNAAQEEAEKDKGMLVGESSHQGAGQGEVLEEEEKKT